MSSSKDSNDATPRPINLSKDIKVVGISAGGIRGNHSLILTDKGQVYSFGSNRSGQLGRVTKDFNDVTPRPINLSKDIKVVDISAGEYHSLILTDKGQVYSFGDNEDAQLGRVTEDDKDTTPMPINLGKDIKIVSISAGGWHSLILTDKGQVYSFGSNGSDQLGRITENYSDTTPRPINLSEDIKIVDISAGGEFSLILTDKDQVYSFGDNFFDQLGLSQFIYGEKGIKIMRLNE